MAVIEFLLRVTTALVLGDPATGSAPLVVLAAVGVTAVGLTAVTVGALVAAVLSLVLGLARARPVPWTRAPEDLVTRIAWSHPDAAGHVRPRGPGVVVPA